MAESRKSELFTIPLPGGRVARVPIGVLEEYVTKGARSLHMEAEATEDVHAHSMAIDPTTGASMWHTDWELGHCDYTDEGGFPQSSYAWHRHPLGTEYTETYQK